MISTQYMGFTGKKSTKASKKEKLTSPFHGEKEIKWLILSGYQALDYCLTTLTTWMTI
jgi:hypothetical protein